ncbi:MAG: carboxypeptidase-like regulatory domain-containing protein, partial [Bacillota bacterium]
MRLVLQTFLTVLLLFSIEVFAQTGKISGTVKDSRTGETLMGVNVIVEGTKLGAASNIDGFYAVLNVPPGTYTVKASLIGYNATSVTNVKVYIDQTTNLDLQLTETSITTSEVVVVAQAPVVQKDVSSSSVNLDSKSIENLPTVSVATVVGLQAGIEGGTIRGGSSDQSNYLLNGVSLKDERTNSPYTNLSTTNIEAVQVLTGGFNAEYGNIRSGLVSVVTKEGSTDRFTVNFVGRYRPAAPKHFGMSPQDPNAFWMRPYVDDAVAWTGTKNGAWDQFTQNQYPDFQGWNAYSAQMFRDNPATALTPQELQKLWLFQHRRDTEIKKPDYDIDLSVGGYFPGISKQLGNLRFMASYKGTRSMYIVPLSRDAYSTQNFQLRLTSDIGQGMKLNVEGLIGSDQGTTSSGDGSASTFTSSYGIASSLSYFSQFKTIENRLFTDDYFSPTASYTNNVAAKFTHALSANSFYEVTVSRFSRKWETGPGRLRDTTKIYKFGNNTWVDEGPYGFWESPTTGVDNFRMSVGFSNARDSSKFNSYNAKFELLRSCGYEVELMDTGCCGMAGTFGYETEHYEV